VLVEARGGSQERRVNRRSFMATTIVLTDCVPLARNCLVSLGAGAGLVRESIHTSLR
jgi:hypothetical protein